MRNSKTTIARNRLLQELATGQRPPEPSFSEGKAWSEWAKWDAFHRRHLLRVWCKLSRAQIDSLYRRDWYALSLHVRKRVKAFFEKSPVLDQVLGKLRYPENSNV